MAKQRGTRKAMQDFLKALRTFHGFDIDVILVRKGLKDGHKTRTLWGVVIGGDRYKPPVFRGTYAEVFSWLQGYQAGWISGRQYTREETEELVVEISNQAKSLGRR